METNRSFLVAVEIQLIISHIALKVTKAIQFYLHVKKRVLNAIVMIVEVLFAC